MINNKGVDNFANTAKVKRHVTSINTYWSNSKNFKWSSVLQTFILRKQQKYRSDSKITDKS